MERIANDRFIGQHSLRQTIYST